MTAVAVVSLAVGIAANATIFSLVQAVEFPSLIYPDASRIVFLESRNVARQLIGMPVSAPDAIDVTASSRSLALASLTADETSTLRAGSGARRVSGRRVTSTFFDVMRVAASLGRVLTANDGPEVIVISDALWRAEFAADASMVGRPIRLGDGSATVAGVMPAGFDADADFWAPFASSPAGFARDDRQFSVFARIARGASLEEAERELADLSGRLAADHPATNADWVMFPTRLTRMHGRDSRHAFILLQGAVGFVLLIACANIANILLARGTRRRHEMAVRMSLSASRSRLVSALLTESVLLSLLGGAAGVVLSMWGIRLARVLGGFPAIIDPRLNLMVLAFTGALSMLTGVLCGLVPALRASCVAPEAVLREDGRGAGLTRGRLRAGLVAVQIASALVLAMCATLMLRTLANRQQIDLGFDPRGAVAANLVLSGDRYRQDDGVRTAVAGILEHLRRNPDVLAAGASAWALPAGAGAQRELTLPAERNAALGASIRRGIEAVTPEYFAALGAPLTSGRAFTAADRQGAPAAAIVNEELARRLWPNRSPVGEPLRLGSVDEAAPIATVIGVVRTIRRSAMHDTVVARVYVPFAQFPNPALSFVVRARGDAGAIGREFQAAVQAADPALIVDQLRTVEEDLAQFVAPIRLITSLLAGFGLAGVLLAGLGVFGTMSYTVSQREREMAVRSALGAGRRDIFRLVFQSALRIVAGGVVAGVAVTVVATRALASFLFGISPTDPLTFAVVIGFLLFVSVAACYRPARLAATTDPMSILRHQ